MSSHQRDNFVGFDGATCIAPRHKHELSSLLIDSLDLIAPLRVKNKHVVRVMAEPVASHDEDLGLVQWTNDCIGSWCEQAQGDIFAVN